MKWKCGTPKRGHWITYASDSLLIGNPHLHIYIYYIYSWFSCVPKYGHAISCVFVWQLGNYLQTLLVYHIYKCHINKGQHILQSANWLLSSFEKDMNHIEPHCKAVPGQTDCLFPLVPLPFCKATSSKAAAKLRQFEGFEHRSMIQPAPVGWTTSTAFLMRSTYDEWIWAFQSAEIPWFITIFPCQGC